MADAATLDEIAHVIGCDIVAFSRMPYQDQIASVQAFRGLLQGVLAEISDAPLVLDTGDGAILVFGGPVSVPLLVLDRLWVAAHASNMEVRLGLHSGPVTRLADLNGKLNAYGPGVNFAQRVMDAAASGGVLLSSTAADFARTYEGWSERLCEPETVVAKHGVHLTVFGLVGRPGVGEHARHVALPKPRHNLKQRESRFIGRHQETQRLVALLLDQRRRLVTVAGPGGIGKTSLACHVAESILTDFADGVWIVECDALRTGEEVQARLADLLGNKFGDLELAQCLVVLDCLERTRDVVPVLEDWLRSWPGVQLLVTSRSVLSSKWETEMFLGPMPLDDGHGGEDAIRLFEQAAQTVDADFSVKRGNRKLVMEIAHAVEGVPLALVLAAGRLRYASLQEIASSLAVSRLGILKRRASGEDRHADLARVVSESMDLLQEAERAAMLDLSVFAGGFYLVDAVAVVGTMGLQDAVEALRDNSLVVGSIVGQRMRFRTLDVVAEYVGGQVAPNRLDELRSRHASHFTNMALSARRNFDAGRWGHEAEQFWADLANFRLAIGRALEAGDSELLLSLAASLARVFMEAGLRSDFERLALAAEASPECSDDLRLELLGLLGGIYRRDDNRERAEAFWLKRAETLSKGLDFERQADAWVDLACLALESDDLTSAAMYLAQYEVAASKTRMSLSTVVGLVALGELAARQGDLARAIGFCHRVWHFIENKPVETRSLFTHSYLAELASIVGEPRRSVEICLRALPSAIEGKHLAYAGRMLVALARGLDQLGHAEQGVRALLLAERVPKSSSRIISELCKNLREVLLTSPSRESLLHQQKEFAGLDWYAQSKALVEDLGKMQ